MRKAFTILNSKLVRTIILLILSFFLKGRTTTKFITSELLKLSRLGHMLNLELFPRIVQMRL